MQGKTNLLKLNSIKQALNLMDVIFLNELLIN